MVSLWVYRCLTHFQQYLSYINESVVLLEEISLQRKSWNYNELLRQTFITLGCIEFT
jgi:hypothetical protein